MSTVFSYFASAAAAFHVHVSACSYLSLPCVYLRSVRCPLHLAYFHFLALFSVLFICILLVLPYCKRFRHSKYFGLVSSSQALYCSFEFNFLISYFFCRLGFYFDYFRLEKFLDYLLLPHSRCNSLYCLAFLQLVFRFGFAGI